MSTERIIVHRDVTEAFTSKLKEAVENLSNNSPVPVVITATSAQKTKMLVFEALKKGATFLTGDCDMKDTTSTRLRPIVLEGVTRDMEIYHQETFGPSVSLIVVNSEDEAIKVCNDTEYGLTAAVFTENLGTGFRVANQIVSGAVHINSMTIHDEAALPHGGVQKSGYGRFNGNAGLDEFLQTKIVTWQG